MSTLSYCNAFLISESSMRCSLLWNARQRDWTKLLIRSLRAKDNQSKGVRVIALNAWKTTSLRWDDGSLKAQTTSYIVPRFTEVLIILVLTVWFRVDGFSSSLVARRAIRDYIVDNRGSGFGASEFLTRDLVIYNAGNTHDCHVLTWKRYSCRIQNIIVYS